MLKHIFVIVSPILEPKRFEYLFNYLKTNDLKTPITFWEPLYKNRDENLFHPKKYINLTPGEIGLAQTYENLFEYIVENFNKNDLFLTLESDVIFEENFPEKLNTVINEILSLKKEKSITWLGNGCNLKPEPKNRITENLYIANRDKCTDSMIFTYSSIVDILNFTKQNLITKPVDNFWSFVFGFPNISVYWTEPHIIQQGSQLGIYPSAIR